MTTHISPASVQIAHALASVHGHEWATLPVADIIAGWNARCAEDHGTRSPAEYIDETCEALLGERSSPGIGFSLDHRTGGGRGRLSWEIGTGTYRSPEVDIRIHRPSLAWRMWSTLQGLTSAAVPDHHVRQAIGALAPFEPAPGDLEVLWAHLNTTALEDRGERPALHVTGDLADVRLDHLVSLYASLAAVCRALGNTRPLRELYDALHALATVTEGAAVDIDLAGLTIGAAAGASNCAGSFVLNFWGRKSIEIAVADGQFLSAKHRGTGFGPGLLNILESRPEVIARLLAAVHYGIRVADPEVAVRAAMRQLGLHSEWTTARAEDRSYIVTIPRPAPSASPTGLEFDSET